MSCPVTHSEEQNPLDGEAAPEPNPSRNGSMENKQASSRPTACRTEGQSPLESRFGERPSATVDHKEEEPAPSAPVATTTTTTEFVRVRRDENYWPKIREVIGNNGEDGEGHRVKLWLDCSICKNAMLRFPTPKFPVRGDPAPAPLEKITVLWCGHIFHFTCMQTWMRESRCRAGDEAGVVDTGIDGGGCAPSCPSCREPLVYGECGHAMNLKLVAPSPAGEIERRLPRVRDEGGVRPRRCADCQLAAINGAAEAMARLVCEPSGDKDPRGEEERRTWREECEEQFQTTATIKHLQWAKRSNRW